MRWECKVGGGRRNGDGRFLRPLRAIFIVAAPIPTNSVQGSLLLELTVFKTERVLPSVSLRLLDAGDVGNAFSPIRIQRRRVPHFF